jgi:hypothetical protein
LLDHLKGGPLSFAICFLQELHREASFMPSIVLGRMWKGLLQCQNYRGVPGLPWQ